MSEAVDDEKHDADEHAKLVLEAMRRLSDEQVERAERVRNSARNTFLFLSGIFTVAQTATISALNSNKVSHTDRAWVIALAITAAGVLAFTGFVTIIVDHLRRVRDISTDDIEREANAAVDNDEFVGDRLITLYRASAKGRAAAVDARAKWLTSHTWAAVAVVALVVTETVLSLISRIA
jgi:hypothetical protein